MCRLSLPDSKTSESFITARTESLQRSWQVAYVWAFIVKFQQINHIRKLECLEE